MSVVEINDTWESSARSKVELIWQSPNVYNRDCVSGLRNTMDYMIDTYFDSSSLSPVENDWLVLARLSIDASRELSLEHTWDTVCAKQRDYGPNNIARFGAKGIILRLHDKVARLENLLASGKDAANESIYDTYMDIVGYSVIGLMLIDGSFFFPMSDA